MHRKLFLSGVSSRIFLFPFTTVIGAPVGIASTSISPVFLISSGIFKMFLKTMGRKEINTGRLLY